MVALEARTEGWAAGLQLAALSLQGHPDVYAFVQAFSGSHRYVLDYLAEEVLDRQPRMRAGFLLETSILDRVCGRWATRSPAAATARSAGAGRAGQPVPDPPGRGTPLVALPPPVRRPAASPAGTGAARAGAGAAPGRGRLVRGPRAGR